MTIHTDGYWLIEDEPNPADDGHDDVGPVTQRVRTRDAYICGGIANSADAHLIANAPALLAVLRRCVEGMEIHMPAATALHDARNLIAKATGGAA